MLSNSPRYQINAFNAAKEIARGAAHRSGPIKCNCNLKGYVARALHPNGLSGFGADVMSVPALIPISDRSAVDNAVKYFKSARGGTLNSAPRSGWPRSGMGDAARVQGAASMAAAGAKIGSIVPGIGTVIGAVVGAIAGWLMGASKPVRPSAAEMQKCNALLAEYTTMAGQSPSAPIPLDKQQLTDINWCLDAVYGGKYVGVKDPRWFAPDVDGMFIPIGKSVVRKIYETPVGQVVNIEAISFKDPKGRTISFKGFSFVNPVFTDLKTFVAQYFAPMAVKMCENTAGKGAPGCQAYYGGQVPEFTRWLYDLLAYCARTELPNISESDLKAASEIAATTGNSAKDVVSVVESIIKRTVQSGETAALLSPQSSGPGAAPAPPLIPTQAITPLLPSPAAPVAPLNPISTPATPLSPTPDPSVSPFPSTSSGGGNYLVPVPGATPDSAPVQPVQPVQAGAGGSMPIWMTMLAAAFAFAVVMPKKRGTRK